MQDNGKKYGGLTRGDELWLDIRRTLPADKLEAVVEMLNSYADLKLTEGDISALCERQEDGACPAKEGQGGGILVAYGGEELTDDDFAVLEKLKIGTVMPVQENGNGEVTTEYAFSVGGKKYPAAQVSAILNRLNAKFGLLSFHADVKNTSRGLECVGRYPVLNRKGRALLREREKN